MTVTLFLTPYFVWIWLSVILQKSEENYHRARVSFTTTAEREIGRDVQAKLCYISLDCDTELKSTVERSDNQIHMLSDGDIITVR